MIAHRADIGSFYSDYNMTAVAALPDCNLTFFEDLGSFHVAQKSAVTFLVMLFDAALENRAISVNCSEKNSAVHLRSGET